MSNIVKLSSLETINTSELVDYTVPNTSIEKTIRETINNNEIITYTLIKNRAITENINNNEKSIFVYNWQFSTTKIVDIVEQIYTHAHINRTKNNTEKITEYISYIKQQYKLIVENIQNNETVVYTIPNTSIEKNVVETASNNEKISKSVIQTKNNVSNINNTENINYFVNTSPISKDVCSESVSLKDNLIYTTLNKNNSNLTQENVSETTKINISFVPKTLKNINISDLICYNINNSTFIQNLSSITRVREKTINKVVSYTNGTVEKFSLIKASNKPNVINIPSPINTISNYTLIKYNRQFTTNTYLISNNKNLLCIENINISKNTNIKILYSHNQIITNPSNIYYEFGIITKDTLKNFTINSAYLQDLTITSINIPNYLGIISTLSVGDVLHSLSNITFTLTIFLNKGAVVLDNANFSVEFNNSVIVSFYISATRQAGIINAFKPDYKSYKTRIQYATKTFRAMNGVEQRRNLLTSPKRSVQYTRTFHTSSSFEQAKSILKQNLYKLNYQPLWESAIHPITSSTSKAIPYINNSYPFKVGNYLCIWSNNTNYKIVKITNKTDTTLLINITTSWTTQDYIIPLIKVMADVSNPTSYTNNFNQTIQYKFRTLS